MSNRLFRRLQAGIIYSEDIERIRVAVITTIQCEHCKNFGWNSEMLPYSVIPSVLGIPTGLETWHHPACKFVQKDISLEYRQQDH